MFDMGKTRLLKLHGGPYDGKTVEVDAATPDFWAYLNMYNTVRVVAVGGMPRSDSMADYQAPDGSDVAEYVAPL